MKNATKNTQEGGINVRQFIKRCRERWYVFLICPALMFGLAWLYARYQVPVYEVRSSILLKDEKNKQGVSASDLISKELGLTNEVKMLADESKIMASYTIVEKIVKQLKLDRVVYKKGTLLDEELYGADSPILIDSLTLWDSTKTFKAALDIIDNTKYEFTTPDGTKQTQTFGIAFNNNYGRFLIKKVNTSKNTDIKTFNIVCNGIEKTTQNVMKSIDIVVPKKESNIIEPTLKTTIPNKAKDIIYKMVDVYNNYRVNDKKQVSQNTLDFIQNRLLSLTSELSGVEKNMESYKKREGMTADAQTDIGFFFSRLNEYDGELVKLEVQNNILEGIDALLRKTSTTFDLLPTNLDIKSTTLQNQISDYNKLVLERNKLVKFAGDSNPTLKGLMDDLYSLKRAIIDNVARMKQENKSILLQTQSKNNQYNYKLGKTPRNDRELMDIKRQQNIKEGLYLFLLQKQEETAIAMIGATADARIIDRPTTGDIPLSKKKPVIYLMSIFAGLVASLGLLLLHSLFINTIQSENDILEKTTMPILAKIPHQKGNKKAIIGLGSPSIVTEMFGFLRSNLQFLLPYNQSGKGHVILITSTKRGEGKSFVTLNLGMSLAMTQKKTVVLNLDLRRNNAAFQSISSKNVGISNYLTTELYPHEIIQPSSKHPDLFYIGNGNIPPNPSAMLENPQLGQLIAYLKNNFDYIIITTPPVGLVSDALSLKQFADASLLIVRQGFTKLSDLKIVQDIENKLKLPNPVIVHNGLKWNNQRENVYYSEKKIADYKSSAQQKRNVFSGTWLKEMFS
jgi:tyrosine-protein kinase Etk/Wzc